MTTCSLLLLVAAVVACVAVVSPAAAESNPCPWTTVAQVDNPFVQDLGKWAVEQNGAPLRFDKVESAKVQGVGECFSIHRNYELIIDAANRVGPGDDKYKAVVFVTKTLQPQKLVSFRAVTFRGE